MDRLIPIADLTVEDARAVRYWFTDVDDTITTHGKLHTVALAALWRLHDAGIKVICVTGGSAGWGDIYLRQWPVEAVIAESGAVSLYRDGTSGQIRHYIHPSIVEEGYKERAKHLIDRVLAEVPDSKVSSDQFSRLYDIAFDYGSEPPYLCEKDVRRVAQICEQEGAGYAISSIHVNAWFGAYDKREGVRSFMHEVLGMEEQQFLPISGYSGDAPNDMPMFGFIPISFGVANVLAKAAEMPILPKYVATKMCGEGFAQIVDAVLAKRIGKE